MSTPEPSTSKAQASVESPSTPKKQTSIKSAPEPFTPPNQTAIETPSAPRGPSPEKPGLYLPTDRTGEEGGWDREARLRRLAESIHLDPSQLLRLLKHIYKYEHACRKVKWKPELLYEYVPREFETATVTEDVAFKALDKALDLSLVRVCKPSAWDINRYTVGRPDPKSPKYTVFVVSYYGWRPDIPEELEEWYSLKIEEDRPSVVFYPRRRNSID